MSLALEHEHEQELAEAALVVPRPSDEDGSASFFRDIKMAFSQAMQPLEEPETQDVDDLQEPLEPREPPQEAHSLTRSASDLTLTPMELKPTGRKSLNVSAMAFIQQIDRIEINSLVFSEQKGKMMFQVDVFFRHETNRIPSNQRQYRHHHQVASSTLTRTGDLERLTRTNSMEASPAAIDQNQEPHLQVLRTFSQFVNLRRDTIAFCGSKAHLSCYHCIDFDNYLILHPLQPNGLAKLLTCNRIKMLVKVRQRMLQKYLNQLVQFAKDHEKGPNGPVVGRQRFGSPCAGMEKLPIFLEKFLRDK